MKCYGLIRIAKEIQFTNNAARFTIAQNDYKGDGHFFNAVAFRKTGENIFNNCKVGDRIFIDGDLYNNNYEKPDGTKVYSNQIVINTFEFIEQKHNDSTHEDMRPKKNKRQQEYDEIEVQEDESLFLPF